MYVCDYTSQTWMIHCGYSKSLFCKRDLSFPYTVQSLLQKRPIILRSTSCKMCVGHSYTQCVTHIHSSWVVSVHMQDMCGHPYTQFVTHVQSSCVVFIHMQDMCRALMYTVHDSFALQNFMPALLRKRQRAGHILCKSCSVSQCAAVCCVWFFCRKMRVFG